LMSILIQTASGLSTNSLIWGQDWKPLHKMPISIVQSLRVPILKMHNLPRRAWGDTPNLG
jgi:hypothetical protein